MATFESSLKPRLIYVFAINDDWHEDCVKIGETTVWILGRKAALPEKTAVDYLIVSDELKEKDGLSAEHLILCCYPDQTERLFEAYRGRYRSGAAAAGEKLEWFFPVIQ